MLRLPALLLLATIAVSGCESGRVPPPDVQVVTVHAAAGFDAIEFWRVERQVSTQAFRSVDAHSFDADTYRFNLHVQPYGGGSARISTFTETLDPANVYIFTFVDVGGLLQTIVTPTPQFDAQSSNAQVQVVHAASDTGPVDVYLHAAGADLSTLAPVGSADFMGGIGGTPHAPGDYRITVTEAGAPAAVVFVQDIALTAGRTQTIVLTDSADAALASMSAVTLSPTPTLLLDLNSRSAVRVVNAIGDKAPRDTYLNADFSAPLIAAAPYGAATGYVDVPLGDNTLTTTPAGNPGVTEVETPLPAAPERSFTQLLTRNLDGIIESRIAGDDRRPLTNEAKLTVINGARNFIALGVSVSEVGTDWTEAVYSFLVLPSQISPPLRLLGGTYDVFLVDTQTSVPVAGPVTLEFTNGVIHSVLALDADDGASAEIVPIEGF